MTRSISSWACAPLGVGGRTSRSARGSSARGSPGAFGAGGWRVDRRSVRCHGAPRWWRSGVCWRVHRCLGRWVLRNAGLADRGLQGADGHRGCCRRDCPDEGRRERCRLPVWSSDGHLAGEGFRGGWSGGRSGLRGLVGWDAGGGGPRGLLERLPFWGAAASVLLWTAVGGSADRGLEKSVAASTERGRSRGRGFQAGRRSPRPRGP